MCVALTDVGGDLGEDLLGSVREAVNSSWIFASLCCVFIKQGKRLNKLDVFTQIRNLTPTPLSPLPPRKSPCQDPSSKSRNSSPT